MKQESQVSRRQNKREKGTRNNGRKRKGDQRWKEELMNRENEMKGRKERKK
jgi:hypothetical protein